MTSTPGARAVPFHCPYCGDEDLRPHGETHGAWECRACQRAFALKFIGILNPALRAHPDGDHLERGTAP